MLLSDDFRPAHTHTHRVIQPSLVAKRVIAVLGCRVREFCRVWGFRFQLVEVWGLRFRAFLGGLSVLAWRGLQYNVPELNRAVSFTVKFQIPSSIRAATTDFTAAADVASPVRPTDCKA